MKDIFCCVYFFIFGTVIASFVNVVIYRIPLKLDYVKGHSFCPYCHHHLKMIHMIPIISYIVLKGRCYYCRERISIHDTIVELIGGILCALCYYFELGMIVYLMMMLFYVISMIDIKTMEIPYECMVVYLILILIYRKGDIFHIEYIIGALIMVFPLVMMNLIKKDCIGGGDIIILGMSGLLLGYRLVCIGLFIAVLIACFYAIMKRLNKNDYLAFGPFICVGMMSSLLFGERILYFYMLLF